MKVVKYVVNLILSRGLNIIKFILLARIVDAEFMGLITLIMIILAAIDILTDFGISTAVISIRETPTDPVTAELSQISVIRGLAMGILLAIISILQIYFFNADFGNLLIIASLVPIIKSFFVVPVAILNRSMDFSRLGRMNAVSSLVDLSICIAGIYFFGNIVFFVIGLLISECVRFLFIKFEGLIRFEPPLSKESSDILSQYGIWIWFSNIVTFILNQGDRIIIGSLVGIGALGNYQVMNRFSNTFIYEPFSIFNQVLSPIFAKNNRNIEYKRKNLLLLLKIILLSFIIMVILAVVLYFKFEAIVTLVIGSKWIAYKEILTILTFASMLGVIISICVNYLKSIGQAKYITLATFLQLFVYIPSLFLMYAYDGITGVAWANVIAGSSVLIYLIAVCFFSSSLPGERNESLPL